MTRGERYIPNRPARTDRIPAHAETEVLNLVRESGEGAIVQHQLQHPPVALLAHTPD
jgi:hypothetical protein